MSDNPLVEGLKHKGNPFIIPNSSRDFLPLLCKERGYEVGVEIGVGQGKFTEKFAQAGLKIIGIDPWKPYQERMDKKSLELIYNQAQARLSAYPNVTIIRNISMRAIKSFENEEIDFVYIDGCHEFRYIAEDIYEWAKKVKSGGIVAGHDYQSNLSSNIHCSVIVDAYVKLYGIKQWFLFGEDSKSYSRKVMNWMFIK